MTRIYSDEIMAFAEEALGGEENGAVLRRLCEASSGELRARLRENVEAEDIRELFVTAASVLALSMYMALTDSLSGEEVRAGELSVKKRALGASAAELRKQAETLLAEYLRDEGFAFMGVSG